MTRAGDKTRQPVTKNSVLWKFQRRYKKNTTWVPHSCNFNKSIKQNLFPLNQMSLGITFITLDIKKYLNSIQNTQLKL